MENLIKCWKSFDAHVRQTPAAKLLSALIVQLLKICTIAWQVYSFKCAIFFLILQHYIFVDYLEQRSVTHVVGTNNKSARIVCI